MSRRKAAVSVTLDHAVLDFFGGRNRSAHINRILKEHIRARLGDPDAGPRTNRQIFAAALAVVQEQFGHDCLETHMMLRIFDIIENEVSA